jgi:indolepyruvate decarboxylase
MQLGEALTRALAAHGATEIFGIPGDFALPLFKSFEDSSILPLYTLSHEPAVGFAADASARMRCRPGVAAVTYGAGALNMVVEAMLPAGVCSPTLTRFVESPCAA